MPLHKMTTEASFSQNGSLQINHISIMKLAKIGAPERFRYNINRKINIIYRCYCQTGSVYSYTITRLGILKHLFRLNRQTSGADPSYHTNLLNYPGKHYFSSPT